MGPPRAAFVVRRAVMTLVAVGLCLTLWKDNHSSRRTATQTSLVRRRILQNDNAYRQPLLYYLGFGNPVERSEYVDDYLDSIDSLQPPPEKVDSSTTSDVVEETAEESVPESTTRRGPETLEKEDGKLSKDQNEEREENPVVDKTPERESITAGHHVTERIIPTPSMEPLSTERGPVEGHKQPKKHHKDVHREQENVPRQKEEHQVKTSTQKPKKVIAGHTILQAGKSHVPRRSTTTSTPKFNETTAVPFEEECTPPAYHEFPPDLFNNYQRAHGAVIVHIAVIVYMFYAVAVVCDDYFVASLEECCSRLNLSEDVAGATFMAAGSSAPELFTAILGVLVAKGDVGTGTIVGSAVFNVLFVIGICGIFSNRIVELTWWPLFRDSLFYSATVIILIAIIFDSEVTWYESLIMMIIYGLYIVVMKFNSDIHFWTSRRLGIEDDMTQNVGILAQGDKKNYSSYVPFNNEIDECASMPVTAHYTVKPVPADESIRNMPRLNNMHEAALVIMMRRPFCAKTRFRSAGMRIMCEQRRLRKEASKMHGQVSIDSQDIPKWKAKSISTSMGLTAESNWKSLPSKDDGCMRIIKWIIQAPLLAVLHYTIPDCRKDRWRKFFILTFLASITWTAIFSYVMIWMVTLVGYTLGIPDSIMGITFLAAGTSVPDAFASLIVARQGQGDMAVSNSLGSNIFDILIGLALPWFIQTTIVEPGSIAVINSRGMVYSVILLFLTIIITIGGIYFSKWQLTRNLGILLLSVYAVFLVASILLEFNLLGYVNPPMCQD